MVLQEKANMKKHDFDLIWYKINFSTVHHHRGLTDLANTVTNVKPEIQNAFCRWKKEEGGGGVGGRLVVQISYSKPHKLS